MGNERHRAWRGASACFSGPRRRRSGSSRHALDVGLPAHRSRASAELDGLVAPPRSSSRWRRASRSTTMAIAVARREVHHRVGPAGSSHATSTRLMLSTKSRQSIIERKRMLPMLLLIETWSAACCWLSDLHHLLDRSARLRRAIAPSRSTATPASGSAPAAGARVRRRMSWTSAASSAPCRPAPAPGSSGRIRRSRSAGRPSSRRCSRSIRCPITRALHPAQVFDQCQPQHDRNRPQLAQLQRRDALVGRDEAAEAVGIDAAVAVRDALEGDVVDPGKSADGPAVRRGSSRL